MTGVITHHDLFGLTDVEIVEIVDTKILQETNGVRALQMNCGHMVREVSERSTLHAGSDLIDPVRVFVGDNGEVILEIPALRAKRLHNAVLLRYPLIKIPGSHTLR
jgi:hypothetical protein